MSRRLLVLALVLVAIAPFVPLLVNGEVPILRDHRDYFVPLRSFTATELSEGRVPYWNPYNGSGEPWLANPQTAIFYPPAYIFLVLPFAFAYVAYLAIHVALLAVGSFQLFVRRASPAAAALGAVAVALSGPVLSMLDVGNNLTTFAWIPATLACAMSRRDEQPRCPRGALALMLALMFLAGEPFLAAIGWVAVAVTLLARRFRRGAIDAAATFATALLLCAAQLLPFLASLRGSDRAAGLGAQALENSLTPHGWIALLIPPGSGESVGFHALLTSQQFIVSLYAGATVIALAVLALSRAFRDDTHQRGVLLAAAVGLGVMLFAAGRHLPGAGAWWPAIGLDAIRYPSRLAPFAVLAIGYLAAVGAGELASASRARRLSAVGLALMPIAIVLFLVPAPPAVTLHAVVAAALGALVVALGGMVAGERRVLLLALLVIVDLGIASRSLLDGFRPGPSESPIAGVLLAEGERAIHLPDPGAPLISNGYRNLLTRTADASTPAPVVGRTYSTIHDAALFVPRTDILNFLSVRVLLTPRDVRHPSFELVADGGQTAGELTYRNRLALPPAALWSDWTSAPSNDAAVATLLSGKVVADRRPIVVGIPPARFDPKAGSPGMARLLRLDTQSAIVDVHALRPALLTLNQNDAAGWKVAIDGKRAPAHRVNGNFLGVMVPPGAHRVVWDYTPPLLHSGIALTILGIVLLSGDALLHSRRRARR